MKKDLHPDNYRLVVFQDTSNGFSFLTRSTAVTDETVKWEDGQEYPLIKMHISSTSHPFFTGEERVVDVEGRVDRFKARRAAADAKRAEAADRAAKKVKAKKPAKAEKNEKSEETAGEVDAENTTAAAQSDEVTATTADQAES